MRPRFSPGRALIAGAVCAAVSVPAPPAAAQSVRGTLVEDGSGRPLGGAVMVLLDAAGEPVARAFTRDDGRFFLSAPGPGRYSLRSQRIGFRTTTTPNIAVAADQVREVRVEAHTVPVKLATVHAAAERRCVARSADAGAVFALWDEARKALDATALTQTERLLRVTLVQFERELDPGSLRVRQEHRTNRSGVSENPFVSRPAAELSELGYVRDSADARVYYAPDARVLLSETFGTDHCFRVHDGPAEPGLIGLAFEPVRHRAVPDIAGVLWLDRGTAELRWLEYRYTGVRLPASSVEWGGRIAFQRMPAGTWIVRRWRIRMPVAAPVRDASGTTAAIPGQRTEERVRLVVRAVREAGGEVTSVDAPGGPGGTRAGVVAGMVIDSSRGGPLAGALVALEGTDATAVTDADGRFRLMGLLEGSYSLTVSHPRLDSLGATVGRQDVVVRNGGESDVTVAVPPLRAVLAAQCPDSTLGPGRVAIRGAVRTAEGEPVSRAVVSASWKQHGAAGGGKVRAETKRADVLVNGTGRYLFCGLPAGAVVRLSAVSSELATLPAARRPSPGELAVYDLVALSKQAVADAARGRRAIDTLPATRVLADQEGPPGFDTRRRQGIGYFLTRADVERRRATRVTDVLRGVPGLVIDQQQGENVVRLQRSATMGDFVRERPGIDREDASSTPASRPATGTRQAAPATAPPPLAAGAAAQDCRVLFVIDGHAMDPMTNVDLLVHPDEIQAVEVYRGAAEVPPQYQQNRASCGAVLIWTRRGGGGP